MESVCATLNFLIQTIYLFHYSFSLKGVILAAIIGSEKISKIKCLLKIPVIQYFDQLGELADRHVQYRHLISAPVDRTSTSV